MVLDQNHLPVGDVTQQRHTSRQQLAIRFPVAGNMSVIPVCSGTIFADVQFRCRSNEDRRTASKPEVNADDIRWYPTPRDIDKPAWTRYSDNLENHLTKNDLCQQINAVSSSSPDFIVMSDSDASNMATLSDCGGLGKHVGGGRSSDCILSNDATMTTNSSHVSSCNCDTAIAVQVIQQPVKSNR